MRSHYEEKYKTSELFLTIYSLIGWLLIIIGALFVLTEGTFQGFFGKIAGLIIVGVFGLSIVVLGEVMRAVIDNSNANQERLFILKSSEDSSPSTHSTKESWSRNKQKDAYKNIYDKKPSKKEDKKVNWDEESLNPYTIDGITFKSKKEMEAYLSNRYPDYEKLKSSDKE